MAKLTPWMTAAVMTALLPTVLVPALATAQQAPAPKDPGKEGLPPEIAQLPFEIRDGYRRFTKRCLSCHDAKRVMEARKTLFEWQSVVGNMSLKKDANIPLDERHSIFLYLTYLQGTVGVKPEERQQYMAFLTKCEDCHGVSLVYKDRYPMRKWPEIVHRMAGKGQAKISPEDETQIMGYIRRMHPDLFGVD